MNWGTATVFIHQKITGAPAVDSDDSVGIWVGVWVGVIASIKVKTPMFCFASIGLNRLCTALLVIQVRAFTIT